MTKYRTNASMRLPGDEGEAMSNEEPGEPSKTVDMLADDLLEESTRIVESKVDPEIDLNTGIYLAECAYLLDKKIRETGQLPKRWWTAPIHGVTDDAS